MKKINYLLCMSLLLGSYNLPLYARAATVEQISAACGIDESFEDKSLPEMAEKLFSDPLCTKLRKK